MGTENNKFVRCSKCRDLGVWLTPKGIIAECSSLQLGFADHPPLSDAAKAIFRAGRLLSFQGLVANPLAFEIARTLATGSTTEPISRQTLIRRHFEYARSQALRHFHSSIEDLRSVWLLPVGSRKGLPHGYWIITDAADFKEWVARTTSAPIKQMATIHKVARANFPVFAEQLELNFWQDLQPTSLGLLA